MIKIENLQKSFGEHVILKNFSCQIQKGEFVAITGPSGCGKTTFLNLIGLIDQNYDGKIILDGLNMKKLSKGKLASYIRNHINYLFQNFALIDDASVEENLMLALYYTAKTKAQKKEMIMNTLKKIGMEESYSNKVFTLSGGEQQRIALARVMLKPGEIILADEPTGNLDNVNRDIVLENLVALSKSGKTVLIVTHDEFISSHCQRIIHLVSK